MMDTNTRVPCNTEDEIEVQNKAKLLNQNINGSDTFCPIITKQNINSVTTDWSLVPGADVYEIEKYHKQRGWEQVAWKSRGPANIENLDENFAYRLRIKALKYDEDEKDRKFVELTISDEVVARTLSAQPTAICLHRAIKKGQQFLVKRILRRRPSLIGYPGPNGNLPLANAIVYGDSCIVDVLLTEGACVHTGNTSNKRTPLHLAFFHGRLPVARILLNKKAQLEATDTNAMTACHFAIDANQLEMLKFGIENHANLEATDACGWTLLLRAVVIGADINAIKLLIMHGANRNVLDKLGQGCMDLARFFNNEPAIRYFEHLNKCKK